ncbi:MAG: hypothetical protein ACJ75Q_01875 [Gaiellaceae bacterium]
MNLAFWRLAEAISGLVVLGLFYGWLLLALGASVSRSPRVQCWWIAATSTLP